MPDAGVEDSGDRFVCPRCGAFSGHVRKQLEVSAFVPKNGAYNDVPFLDSANSFGIRGNGIIALKPLARGEWTATVCASCELGSVWRGSTLIYPQQSSAPSPHPDMPEAARGLYVEASLVMQHSRRAAAALARASLEALLRDLDESRSRKNLQTRIGELQSRINPALWKVLTALRVVGNDSLHGDQDDLVILYLEGDAAEVVEPFFGAINQLVEELITQPRKAEELYGLIPEPKRESAERSGK